MNNMYDAIMKAAQHIELNPMQFDFGETAIPHKCGAPGCALGWIHHFARIEGSGPDKRCIEAYLLFPIMCVDDQDFYDRMTELDGGVYGNWRATASNCARVLRLYAAKYHASEKPQFTGVPDIVRDIFREQTEHAKAGVE